MSHGPTRVASKGACIYCGRRDSKLGDEHIVPLSLGGQHIINEASCRACAATTSRFERDVARELWGDARISYDAPSRRRKERKTHIVLTDPDNPSRRVTVPYRDYPAPMIVYRMGKAGLLEGLPPSADISSMWKIEALSDKEKNEAFERRYGMKLTARFRHVPVSYARLIAKIGYGHVLSSLDPSDFNPICLPYILGHKSNLSFIVGGSLDRSDPDTGLGYVLRTAGFGSMSRLMLVAEVRLFANNQSPTHHVVVGDIVGAEQVKYALSKMGDIKINLLPQVAGKVGTLLDQDHWMPECWPLPYWI